MSIDVFRQFPHKSPPRPRGWITLLFDLQDFIEVRELHAGYANFFQGYSSWPIFLSRMISACDFFRYLALSSMGSTARPSDHILNPNSATTAARG